PQSTLFPYHDALPISNLQSAIYRCLIACIARRRAFLPPPASPAIPPSDFNIFCICTNCFSRRFTSSTDVPLPFAIRFRRLNVGRSEEHTSELQSRRDL